MKLYTVEEVYEDYDNGHVSNEVLETFFDKDEADYFYECLRDAREQSGQKYRTHLERGTIEVRGKSPVKDE